MPKKFRDAESKPKQHLARRSVLGLDVASEFGAYFHTRTLLLSGDVDKNRLDRVLGALELLDREGTTITVKMFSYGGSFYEGFGIYDALKSCKSRVEVIGYGAVMSMATVLLQAADEGGRFLMPNSTIMMHMGDNSSGYDHPTQTRRTIDEMDRIRNRAFNIVAKRMGITLAQFNKKFLFDVYYDADTAVAKGVADAVIKVEEG